MPSPHLPALFIGRFQPFHLGHLHAVEKILQKEKFLIIAIGSAQYYNKPENPFTASQRYEMIEKTLDEKKIPRNRYTILPVTNIENDEKWVDHVDRILPPYKNIYTGSKIVENLYKKHGKHPVKKIKLYKNISATLVRKQIKEGKKWDHLVSRSVKNFLQKKSEKI